MSEPPCGGAGRFTAGATAPAAPGRFPPGPSIASPVPLLKSTPREEKPHLKQQLVPPARPRPRAPPAPRGQLRPTQTNGAVPLLPSRRAWIRNPARANRGIRPHSEALVAKARVRNRGLSHATPTTRRSAAARSAQASISSFTLAMKASGSIGLSTNISGLMSALSRISPMAFLSDSRRLS
jgi:hypothetical protein